VTFRSPFTSIADRARFSKILVRILATSVGPILIANLALNLLLFNGAKERFSGRQENRVAMTAASADERMRSVESAVGVLGRNVDVVAFIVDPDTANFERNLRILNLLTDYVGSHDLISSIYVYSATQGTLIASNGGVLPIGAFRDTAWIEDFKKPFLGLYRMKPRTVLEDNGNENTAVTILRNLPIGSFGKTAGLVVNLKESELRPRIGAGQNGESAESVSYVLDSDGYVLAHPDPARVGAYEGESGVFGDAKRNGRGSAIRRTNEGVRLLTYATGEYTHWIFVDAMPLDGLIAEARGTLLGTFILILIAVAAMILIGFAISKELYLPFAELEDTNRLFENAKPMMVQNLLFNLLHDRLSDEREAEEALRIVGESLPHPRFAVFVFEIDGYEQLREQRDRISLGMLKRALFERLAEILPEKASRLYGEIDDDRFSLLLNHEEDGDQAMLADIGDTFTALVAENFPFTVTCGIGESYARIGDVYRSYSEACCAVQNKLFEGAGKAILFSRMKAGREPRLLLSSAAEKELLTTVKLGRSDAVGPLVDALIDDLRGFGPQEIDSARRVFDRIAGALTVISEEASGQDEGADGGSEERDLLSELRGIETVDGIREWLTGTCRAIAARIEHSRNRTIGAAAERIASYIGEHFDEPGISLVDIGEAVGLSPSYVSRIFKERYAMNYIDFLNGRRVEKAKSLLRETETPIGDIGGAAGFSNFQTFARVFKKSVGTTPGQYRDEIRNGGGR